MPALTSAGFSARPQHASATTCLGKPKTTLRPRTSAGELLTRGDEAWEHAARQYRPMMESIAQSLSPGFTTAAVQRRQQIAEVMPDMCQSTRPNDKSSRKKGDAK